MASKTQMTLENQSGKLAQNILYFARTLRGAGLRVGPAATVDSVRAVRAGGISTRDDFYWTLHCVMVNRREDHVVFDEAFRLFWRSRELVEKMLQMFSPTADPRPIEERQRAAQSRVSQALFEQRHDKQNVEKPQIEVDAMFSTSRKETFRRKDFAQMSAQELGEARKQLAKLVLPFKPKKSRRLVTVSKGSKIDMRRTIARSLRTGGNLLLPKFHREKTLFPPIVILADISGSMSQYSRLFLHFFHALSETPQKVHTFLFGTRLTNITRQLKHKDPDEALAECSDAVADWSGGTRIGATLNVFNRLWSRRVLGQGAVVLFISDGLERDQVGVQLSGEDKIHELDKEIDRLHRSCGRLIWLNPLLRFDGFEAKAQGIRTILPHVDEFRAVHSLEAIGDLCEALSDKYGAWNRKNISPRNWIK